MWGQYTITCIGFGHWPISLACTRQKTMPTESCFYKKKCHQKNDYSSNSPRETYILGQKEWPEEKSHKYKVVDNIWYSSTSGPHKITALTVWSDNASENSLQKTCKPIFVQNSFIFCTKLKLAGIKSRNIIKCR